MGRGASSKRSLAAMVVVAQLVVGTAWAAPAPVRIRVAGERLDPKHAKALEPRVREAAEGLLRDEHGVAIEDDAATEVMIELRPFEDAKKRDELLFRVTVSSDGNEVYGGQPTSCLQCDEAKLLESVRTRVTEAVEHLPEQPEDAEEPVAAEADGADEDAGEAAEGEAETTEPSVEDGPQPTAPPLTLRNAGLGLLIPGGVALGVGIGLVAVGTREVDRGNTEEIAERDFRAPGTAMAILGGIATGAGIGLLIAHATRRPNRDGGGSDRLTWSPVLHRTYAGAALSGRF